MANKKDGKEKVRRRRFLGAAAGGIAGVVLSEASTARAVPKQAGYCFVDLGVTPIHPAIGAVARGGATVVLPNQDADNIYFVDVATLTVQSVVQLAAGARPWEVAVAPNDRFALVSLSRFQTSTAPSQVAVLSMSRRRVVATINVGVGPNGIAFSPAGDRAFVANQRSNSVSIINVAPADPTKWAVIQTVGVANSPHKVLFEQQSQRLYVSCFVDAAISVIDATAGRAASLIQSVTVGNPALLDPFPQFGAGDTTSFALDLADNIGFATNWRSSEIVALDLATLGVLTRQTSPVQNPYEAKTVVGNIIVIASDIADAMAFTIPDFYGQLTPVDHFSMDGTSLPTNVGNNFTIFYGDRGRNRLGVVTGSFAALHPVIDIHTILQDAL